MCSQLYLGEAKHLETGLKETQMIGFLSLKQKNCVVNKRATMVCMTTVSMVFMVFLLVGCKKRTVPAETPSVSAAPRLESVVTNRMKDATYRKALDQNRQEQGKAAFARNQIVEKMEALVAQARAALPAGADSEAVKAELAKNPEWQALEAQNARAVAEIDKTLAEARETVRKRLVDEARDVKAVAEGRAVAADPQSAQ